MNRTICTKIVACCLVAVAALTGMASADPSGSANVLQIQTGITIGGTGQQRTFLTTDSISFNAIYYDPLAACAGVAPTFVQIFVFNLEGLFIQQFNGSGGSFSVVPTDKHRSLFGSLAAGTLPAGSYLFTFLVRTCNDTDSVLLPEFVPFRVVAP
jgi:hypothetical protein